MHARCFVESEIGSASQTSPFLRAQQVYLAEILDCFRERFAEPVAITDDSVLGRGLSHLGFEDVHVVRDTPSFAFFVEHCDAPPIPGEFSQRSLQTGGSGCRCLVFLFVRAW
jgi:hypothetical protein